MLKSLGRIEQIMQDGEVGLVGVGCSTCWVPTACRN
jgi:hypothetical protein